MFYSKSGIPFFTVSILFLPLLLSPSLHAQTVTGRVYDAQSEEPLQDAAIYQRGTTRGVTSAEDGSFEIQLLDNEEEILIVTFLGYESQLIELDGLYQDLEIFLNRSEERRVGKECRYRWWAEELNENSGGRQRDK